MKIRIEIFANWTFLWDIQLNFYIQWISVLISVLLNVHGSATNTTRTNEMVIYQKQSKCGYLKPMQYIQRN